MEKTLAYALLGGTLNSVARCIDISDQAVRKWPEILPPRISDRVIAAVINQLVLGSEPTQQITVPSELRSFIQKHPRPVDMAVVQQYTNPAQINAQASPFAVVPMRPAKR